MSSIPTKQIDGDVAVGRTVNIGGHATVRGNIKACHNLKVEGWLDAPNIKGPNKGLFKTAMLLREAYPNPHEGWWALVSDHSSTEAGKDKYLGQVYIANGGVWVAQTNADGTPRLGGNPTIDSSEYMAEVELLSDEIEGVKGQVIKAENDIKTLKESAGEPGGWVMLDDSGKIPLDKVPGSAFAFGGIIAHVPELVEGQSYSGPGIVVYCEETDRFLLKTIGPNPRHYTNWFGADGYGEWTANGRKPADGRMYADTVAGRLYLHQNSEMQLTATILELGEEEGKAFSGVAGKNLRETTESLRESVSALRTDLDKTETAVILAESRHRLTGILPVDGILDAHTPPPTSGVWYDAEAMLFLSYGETNYYGEDADEYNGEEAASRHIYRIGNGLYRLSDGKMEEVSGGQCGNVYNATAELPLPTGEYYTDIMAEEQVNDVLQAIFDAGAARPGLQITFAIAPKRWKHYQYTGPNETEEQFVKNRSENWTDLGGMTAGSDPVINVNRLCGDKDYTLATAIQELINHETESGISYLKEGLIITYRSSADPAAWETKQYQGSIHDMTAINEAQWKDLSGGGGSVETTDEVEKDNGKPVTSGGVHEALQSRPIVNFDDLSDGENYVFQGINDKGEPIGDQIRIPRGSGGQQEGSTLNIYPETQAVWGAFGGEIVLRAAIKSVSFDGDAEIPGTIKTISILDAHSRIELWSDVVNAASSTSATDYRFEFAFTGFITSASSKDFIIRATDADGNTKSRTITVTAVDVTCTSIQKLNYSAATALVAGGGEKSFPMYRFGSNVSTKHGILVKTEIYYEGNWRILGTAVVTDTYSHNITINPVNVFGEGERLAHGSYPLRIQGTDVASGIKGNVIHTAVLCVDPENQTPLVALRYDDRSGGKVRLYDSVSLDVAAYTPGKTSTPVEVVIDGHVATSVNCEVGQTLNIKKQIQGYAADGSKSLSVLARSGESTSATMTLTVEGSAIDASMKEGALFSFDFSTRSNTETDHTIKDGEYGMTLEGCNWNSNGFVPVLGETALRIAENVKAEIPFAPFSSSALETAGAAIQMAFSTKNVRDKDAMLCECHDPAAGVGFYIRGNEIVLTVLNGTPKRQRVGFRSGEKITLAVVVEPRSKHVSYQGTEYSFVKLYVNGEECAAIGYQPGTSALRQDRTITFDSAEGDFALNYIMAYGSHMEWQQAFRNYLCKLSDVEAMIAEYDKENVIDTTGKPSMSLMSAKGIPYYVVVADRTTFDNFDHALNGGTSTSDQFACTLYYYNPQHPELNFKAVNVLWRRQGTTSAQRPIKNDRFNFNKKNKTTGLKATVTLLNPDDSTELGRKAIAAAKHNKVLVDPDGFAVDTITVKVDFSDSSNANDCGVCDMMNATFRALGPSYQTPAQRAFDGTQDLGDGDVLTGLHLDHSTKNHPIACFRATTDTLQDAWFHAKGNWKEDKGEQTALGFKDIPGYNKGCLNYGDFIEFFGTPEETLAQTEARFKASEGLDTANVYLISQYCGRDYAIYRNKNGEWVRSTGSMKQVNGKWTIVGDVLNPVSGYELLQYAGMDWFQGVTTVEDMMKPSSQVSSWVRKLGLAATEYPAWTYYFECMIDDDRLQVDLALGKKVPYDLFNVLRFLDSCDYSKAAGWKKTWKENAYRFISLESAMAYAGFTDYLAAVDQRAKNMQPMFFLEDGCSVENGVYSGFKDMEPTRMYLNKVYDCDTCNGADNDGGRDIDAEVDPMKPTDESAGYTNPYMGSGSVLFNNMDGQQECWNSNDLGATIISLKSVIDRMRNRTAEIDGKTMVPFSPDGAMHFFVEKRLMFWPKSISSYDGERKYIDNTAIANMPYFYALHGLGLTSLPRFIEQRWAIRDGYYQTGDFFTNPLSGRVSAINEDSRIYITAAATGYFGIGNDASGQLSETVFLEAGQTHAFTDFAHDAGALLYIYQPGRMSRIDLSEMTLAFHFDDLSKLSLAEEVVLGGDRHTADTPLNGFSPLGSLVLGNMPFLRIIDISNTAATSLDAKGCPRVERIVADGTGLTSCGIAQTAPLETLTLPDTMTSLELVNLPNLKYPGGLTMATGTKIVRLFVEGCPATNVSELLNAVVAQGHLRQVRVSGINITSASAVLKALAAMKPVGLAPDGTAYEETGRCSGLQGRWTFTDLADDETFGALQRYFPALELRNCPYSYIVYSDDEADVENISNPDNRTGFKYSNDAEYKQYKASGHFLRLRDSAPICRCDYDPATNKMKMRRLMDQDLNLYADATPFDPTDSQGMGYDVMKYISAFWYKGVNDFVNSEKRYYLSTNTEKPPSTAAKTIKTTVNASTVRQNAAIVISRQTVNEEVAVSDYTGMSVCRTECADMRILRYPGSNGAALGVAFTDEADRVISTFSFQNPKSDFIAGDYLVSPVPEGAKRVYMTVPQGCESAPIILTDSSDIESAEPEWVRHHAELIGVYRGHIDGMRMLRSISNANSTHGNSTNTTNAEWTYDQEGELTSVTVPASGLNMTMKDFCNCARIRGKGYQTQDYESAKDFANIVYALLGTRDVQGRCGMGLNNDGGNVASGGYDTLNPNGFSTYPSSGGTPPKGNLVWGLQNYIGCGSEWLENVAVNISSWKSFRRNRYIEKPNDPVNYIWHIYNPVSDEERTVQAAGSSNFCIGKVRFGLHADIIPSQTTSDNSRFSQHYSDYYETSNGRGRVVLHSNNGAGAWAGLISACSHCSSYTSRIITSRLSAYGGARLAFRGECEFVDE